MAIFQKTLTREARLVGPGLFSGEETTLTIAPAEANAGIIFVRKTAGKTAHIPAHVTNVIKKPRRTCLRNGTLLVETIEHCMAALAGLGVSNATVTLTGESSGELPMTDGSSQPFVDAILSAGLSEQDKSVDPLIITKPVYVSNGDASLAALPGPTDALEIIYEFSGEAPLANQLFSFRLGVDRQQGDSFVDVLAPARTFAYEHEARYLASQGMGTHLSPRDVLVIGKDGPMDNAFRFPDECVRHKILDLIGDLSLVGRPVAGRIIAKKSGHEMNHQLARRLLEQDSRITRVSMLGRDAALDIRRIQRILPHRFPMLLVDRVLEIEGDVRAVGIKNITFNDIFFQGHYPGTPIFPGVLIVEALAQLGGILLSQKLEHTGKLAVLLSMDKVKMRQPVVPGDQLLLEARAVRVKSRTGHVRCQAFVGDKLAAEADIKFMLVDAEPA